MQILKHKSDCGVNDWPMAHVCDCGALQEALEDALNAIGGMPDGFCACFNAERDPKKPDDQHTGECRDARAVLLLCKE